MDAARQRVLSGVVYAVDDESDNLDIVRRTLGDMCTVHVFPDAAAIIAASKQQSPDLVLLDFRMPITNGAEALAKLRAAGVECGAVFVTAYPEHPEVHKLIKAQDAFWVLPKPWKPEELRSQVNMALSLSRVRMRVRNAQAKQKQAV